MNKKTTAPDWSYWGNRPDAQIWQAVALSLNTDPTSLDMFGGFDPSRCNNLPEGFIQRLDIACSNLPPPSMHELYTPPFQRIVWLDDFGVWAKNLPYPWKLPDEFPPLDEEEETGGEEPGGNPKLTKTWVEEARKVASEYICAWLKEGYAPTKSDAALYVEGVFSTKGIYGDREETLDRAYIERHGLKGITGNKPGQKSKSPKVPDGMRGKLPNNK